MGNSKILGPLVRQCLHRLARLNALTIRLVSHVPSGMKIKVAWVNIKVPVNSPTFEGFKLYSYLKLVTLKNAGS